MADLRAFSQPKVLIPDIKGSEQNENELIRHNQHFSNVSVLPVLCWTPPSTIKSSLFGQRHLTKIFCLMKKSNARLPLPQHPIISTQIQCKNTTKEMAITCQWSQALYKPAANSSITIYSCQLGLLLLVAAALWHSGRSFLRSSSKQSWICGFIYCPRSFLLLSRVFEILNLSLTFHTNGNSRAELGNIH